MPVQIYVHLFVLQLMRWSFFSLAVIESREGISPSRSHGTVLETLASHGSSCSITTVLLLYGFTNCQCGKSKGDSLNFFCNHLNEAFL